MFLCHMGVGVHRLKKKKKEDVSSPRTGVTGGFEQRSMGAGNQTRILWRKRIPTPTPTFLICVPSLSRRKMSPNKTFRVLILERSISGGQLSLPALGRYTLVRVLTVLVSTY